MIRRSFRLGLALGVLGGLAFALAKVLGGREAGEPAPAPTALRSPDPWPPLSTADLPVVGDPAAPAADAPVVEEAVVDPVELVPVTEIDPVVEPEPAVEAEPVAPVPGVEEAAAPVAASTAPAVKKKKKAPTKKKAAPATAWVEPEGGVCPTSHPLKAKLASKIFHRPGMLNYERTNPDRCYRDDAAAEADGLRAAKR